MSFVYRDQYCGNPPVHPIAYHAGHADEALRITGILSQAVIEIKAWWKTWRQRREDRRAFEHLLGLDDIMLKDIGVTRADVIWANRLPLSQNAAAELETISRQNRKGL